MKKKLVLLLTVILLAMNTGLVTTFASTPYSKSKDSEITVSQSVYDSVYGLSTPKKYLIGLKKDSKLDQFIDTNGLNLKHPKKINKTNVVSIALEPHEVDKFRKNKDVEFVEENSVIKVATLETPVTTSTQQIIPWGIHSIGADLSLNVQANTKVKIAELDTGIANHPDLKIAGGISFVEGITSYSDDNGHGTHVAGTIAALNDETGIVGSAPNADIYAVKVLDKSGGGYYDQLIQGIRWAIDNKMNIISLSLGGSQNSQALHQIIQEAVQQGILIIAAAGNQGNGSETELYPALYPEVVSVGAVNKSHLRSAFSSTGSELDLVAPGEEILSTTKDGGYGLMSGTSMAAPHVTGAAAALWSRESTSTAEKVKDQLLDTATPLGDAHDYGHGLVNLAKALGLIDKPIPPVESAPNSGVELSPGEFNIKHVDEQLLSYSNKLLDLKNKALEVGNSTLAKSIEQTYYDLISKSLEIHRVPEELNLPNKDEVSRISAENQKNSYLAAHSNDFDKLMATFQESFINYTSQLPINVTTDLEVQSDSYEPNNDPSFAMNVNLGMTYSSYISYSDDIDYYSFSSDKTGTTTIQLQVPADKDYDFYVTDKSGSIVANGNFGGAGTIESSFFPVKAFNTYYIKVVGVLGVSISSQSYTLKMGTVSTFPQLLFTNDPKDVSLGQGLATVYDFVPDKSGNYKLFTGPFGGFGGSNDTLLQIFSDPNLTNLIAYNDDANGTQFSEIRTSLISGFHYYVKISPYSSGGSVFARLTAQLDSPPVNVISVSTPLDIDAYAGESKVFQFTPPTWGYYKIITDYYGGTSNSGQSDTVLLTYSDPNLTTLTSYNDDSNESLFSQVMIATGSTFYLKVAGYNGGSIHTRVMVIPISDPINKPALITNTSIDVSTTPGDIKYFTFSPDTTGMYRFYTSPYQGTGSVNDTVLYLYDSSGHMIARNDDSFGQTGKGFSMLESSLTAGSNYVVMLKHYNRTGSVNARLTVQGSDNHGFLTWPVPSSKQITLPYGRMDYIESNTYHSGIDIQGTSGTEIKSAASGQIVYAGNNGDYGNVVYINSIVEGKQTQTRYAHLKDISVAVGDVVSTGDLIGHMGSTGNTLGGSVLHFAVLESTDGSPCKTDDSNTIVKNPLDYLDSVSDGNINYLSHPFAIGRTPLDTFTFNTVGGSSLDNHVGTSGLFDPPTDPEDRYKGNYDLENTEAYLVKIARDYARRAGVKDDTVFFRDVVIWDENSRTIKVNLHYKTRIYSLDPKEDNSIIVLPVSNGHSKVDIREFIEYFYLADITDDFYGGATYQEYKEQNVDDFIGLLNVGIGNLLLGEKNPWDTPGQRSYYFSEIWPDRFAQMVQDGTPVPESINSYSTWIANNYYVWMESIGLISPTSIQANVNWNNGTYVFQAAIAYADIASIPRIVTFSREIIELGLKYGVKTAITIVQRQLTKSIIDAITEAIETTVSKARNIGISDEGVLGKISDGVVAALNKGSKFTEPTLPMGGVPKGIYEVPTGDEAVIRSITRQNEAADLLAHEGYDIEMLLLKDGGNGFGITPEANPDFKILNGIFDCYSPSTSSVRNIWSVVEEKTTNQARRIVLNLDDFPGSMDDLAKQFNDWPIETLDELIAIKNGQIARLVIK